MSDDELSLAKRFAAATDEIKQLRTQVQRLHAVLGQHQRLLTAYKTAARAVGEAKVDG